MSNCTYKYDGDSCKFEASPDSKNCIWHNNELNKSEPYVVLLLEKTIKHTNGNLKGFDLNEINWNKAKLENTDLSGANLSDAKLTNSNLKNAVLKGAKLHRTDLSKADLSNADLSNADLSYCNLKGANLSNANLSNAILSDTILLETDLSNSNLSNADISSFTWNEFTNFSDVTGFEAEAEHDGDNDETRAYLSPIAFSEQNDEKEISRSSSFITHKYNSNVTLTPQVETPKSKKDVPAIQIEKVEKVTYKSNKTAIWVAAASILIMLVSIMFAAWSMQEMQTIKEDRDSILAKQTSQKEVDTPTTSEVSDNSKLLQKQLNDSEAENEKLLNEKESIKKAKIQADRRLSNMTNDYNKVKLDFSRWEVQKNYYRNMSVKYKKLKERHEDVLLLSQKAKDTSSILASNITRLTKEKTILQRLKDKHEANVFNHETLKNSNSKLEQENKSIRTRNEQLINMNKNQATQIKTAQKTLTAFLDRIRGTKLDSILSLNDSEKEESIPVSKGKPIVLGGDYLLTITVDETNNNLINSAVVVQRPAGKDMPDVNLTFRDGDGNPMRRVTYSFPNSDNTSSFMTLNTNFSCNTFPKSINVNFQEPLNERTLAIK